MALIISSEFAVRVGSGPDEGVSITIGEHDIPGIQDSALMLSFEKQVAEKIWEEIGNRLGKGAPKVTTATPAQAQKEAQSRGLNTAE